MMTLVKFFFICLLFFYLVSCSSSKSVRIFDDEYDANLLLNVLKNYKITAHKLPPEGERKGWSIEVPEKDLNMALDLMEDYCIGQKSQKQIENGTFSNSMEIEKAKNERRKKDEIEDNLRSLPNVRCVNVSINYPESNTISLKPYPAQASVIVQYIGESPQMSSDQIAMQVSRSVPNLAVENVSVSVIKRPTKYDEKEYQELISIKESNSFYNWLLAFGAGLLMIILGVGAVLMLRKNIEDDDYDQISTDLEDQSDLASKNIEPNNVSDNELEDE